MSEWFLALVLGGVFVVALVISALATRHRGWIVAAGVAAAVAFGIYAVAGWDDDDLPASAGFILILAYCSVPWSLGVVAGYFIRRGIRTPRSV